jgi:hypothetical protein
MNYVTVFDTSALPFRDYWIDATLLVAAPIAWVLWFAPRWAGRVIGRPLKRSRLLRLALLLTGAVWATASAKVLSSDAVHVDGSIPRNDCEIVEGQVRHFHPMSWEGHDEESFDVNGVKFWYSDYIITGAFNNAASHGGPIREGLPVRICHKGPEILRLDVAR